MVTKKANEEIAEMKKAIDNKIKDLMESCSNKQAILITTAGEIKVVNGKELIEATAGCVYETNTSLMKNILGAKTDDPDELLSECRRCIEMAMRFLTEPVTDIQ